MTKRKMVSGLLAAFFSGLLSPALASEAAREALGHLPPAPPWSGKSESLVVETGPWQTPAEASGLEETPRYADTMAWLQRLAEASPTIEMISIGQSHEGREILMVKASHDGLLKETTAGRKPLLLVHAGIHSGEIDGKDAGMMLLRDLTFDPAKASLLEAVDLLFIPILNVDGHERFSAFSRPNQRGPRDMGWRTNARNQNLNRDFTKLDTPGVRALMEVINAYEPDLYLDLHVTDGADYQYDITFGGNGTAGWSPSIGRWIESIYRTGVSTELEAWGHIPGSLVFAANGMDMEDGFLTWTGDPRYSNGYGDARHLPTILVENHSLKPYRQRVLGTYILLQSTLEVLAKEHHSLQKAVAQDRARRDETVTLRFKRTAADLSNQRPFKGIRAERYEGPVTGATRVRWTGEPETRDRTEVFIDTPAVSVSRPSAYLIPPAWGNIAKRLRWHGIEVEELSEPVTLRAGLYRLPEATMASPEPWTPNPFEGRVRIDVGEPVFHRTETRYPAGSFRVSTDQPLGDLAILLLEPQSPDSFLQWGFFLEIFTRTEYIEGYLMEPMAEQMLKDDPELAAAFAARKATDDAFAADPGAQLGWFYEKTPYYDDRHLLYPVARVP